MPGQNLPMPYSPGPGCHHILLLFHLEHITAAVGWAVFKALYPIAHYSVCGCLHIRHANGQVHIESLQLVIDLLTFRRIGCLDTSRDQLVKFFLGKVNQALSAETCKGSGRMHERNSEVVSIREVHHPSHDKDGK